jgi:hypothetical protein
MHADSMLKALNLSTFMYQTGTVESLLNLKYWSISLVVVPLVLLALVVAILVRPTVRYVSLSMHMQVLRALALRGAHYVNLLHLGAWRHGFINSRFDYLFDRY